MDDRVVTSVNLAYIDCAVYTASAGNVKDSELAGSSGFTSFLCSFRIFFGFLTNLFDDL